MFGFLKKKPDQTAVASEVTSNVLQIQLALAQATPQGLIADNFALGYMFGFHDSLFQALGVDNDASGFATMVASYHRLCGNPSTGVRVLRRSLDLQSDHAFMKGMFSGGKEAVEWLNEKKIPMGLASHLQGSWD